jgi:protease II
MAFKGHLRAVERVDANNRSSSPRSRGEEHTIAFDEAAYALGLEGGYEYDTTTVRFVYNSMTTPNGSGSTTTWRRASDPAQDPGNPLGPRPRRV